MGFFVFVTGQTGIPCRHLPEVRPMASRAGRGRVLIIFMQPLGTLVAGLAIGHRQNFRLLKMACLASHFHHRCRGINSVAGNAVQGRSVACPVTKAAEDPFVGPLERPRVPGL